MEKSFFEKKYFYGATWRDGNKVRGVEKYENEIREDRKKHEQDEKRERDEKYKQELKAQALREMKYAMLVLGKDFKKNKRLAHMNNDRWEIYKAREYVASENREGHECYNAVDGEKLWINRERWKLLRNK